MVEKSYIYKVTNLVNGKIYIGQSLDPIKRIKQHIDVRSKSGYLLNYAVKKYGVENFLFEVIRSEVPIDQINESEVQCIKEHNCKTPLGYNLTDGGGGLIGHRHSKIAKDKMSRNHVGKKLSEETRKKMSLARKGKKFGPHSEETKKKISESLAGKKLSEETRKKMSLALKGNLRRLGTKHSEETKNKMKLAKSKQCTV